MKLGLLKITDAVIKEGVLPEMFYRLGITPIEINEIGMYQIKTYKCIGECFEDVKEGEIIKEYIVEITKEKDFKINKVKLCSR